MSPLLTGGEVLGSSAADPHLPRDSLGMAAAWSWPHGCRSFSVPLKSSPAASAP